MQTEASDREARKRLKQREEMFHGGGIGLLMEPAPVVRRGSWGVRVAVVAGLLAVCTAGSFASARMWDGQGTVDLTRPLAREIAVTADDRNQRIGAMAWLQEDALEHLRPLLEHVNDPDPEIRDVARALLGRIRAQIPASGGFDGALHESADPTISDDERLLALRRMNGYSHRLISSFKHLIKTLDPKDPLRVQATQYLEGVAKHLQSALDGK